MSISYSGIVGYGKVTLPSVENWNTNTNILRDPPKSVQTRKIDKVGETSIIATQLGESGDRFCENINYYARGTNPMVSVSYNNDNAGTPGSIANRGQSFLPYRIMRDGAFRPPIRTQEHLLPLSRMPRIWTTVNTQPYAPEYTKRIKNCGTAETTREVKNDLLKANCETCKTISYDPGANEPNRLVGFIQDPLISNVSAPKNCSNNNHAQDMMLNTMLPVVYERNRPIAEGYSNKRGYVENPIENTMSNITKTVLPTTEGYTAKSDIRERPIVPNNINLQPNRPVFENMMTNATSIRERPIVPQRISLTPNRPSTSMITNSRMPGLEANRDDVNMKLRGRPKQGSQLGTQAIPKITTFIPTRSLVKVR